MKQTVILASNNGSLLLKTTPNNNNNNNNNKKSKSAASNSSIKKRINSSSNNNTNKKLSNNFAPNSKPKKAQSETTNSANEGQAIESSKKRKIEVIDLDSEDSSYDESGSSSSSSEEETDELNPNNNSKKKIREESSSESDESTSSESDGDSETETNEVSSSSISSEEEKKPDPALEDERVPSPIDEELLVSVRDFFDKLDDSSSDEKETETKSASAVCDTSNNYYCDGDGDSDSGSDSDDHTIKKGRFKRIKIQKQKLHRNLTNRENTKLVVEYKPHIFPRPKCSPKSYYSTPEGRLADPSLYKCVEVREMVEELPLIKWKVTLEDFRPLRSVVLNLSLLKDLKADAALLGFKGLSKKDRPTVSEMIINGLYEVLKGYQKHVYGIEYEEKE